MADFEVLRRIAGVAAITEEETLEARAARDFELEDRYEAAPDPSIAAMSDDEVRDLVSDTARLAVIDFEVSGEKAYRKSYERATRPGGASGITIGIGYDLGYNTSEDVQRDLAGLIPNADIEKLVRACGLQGGAAQSRLSEFRDVKVPWEAALEVFRRATTPRFGRMVLSIFPNSEELKGDCFGALFSLVYNRGSKLSGSSRRHMQAIHELTKARNWRGIPQQFRDMKQLWVGKPAMAGVVKRREAEALLFDNGLAQLSTAAVASAQQLESNLESTANRDAYLEGDGYNYEEIEDGDQRLEATDPNWNKVKWPADDNDAPDYRHITDRSLSGKTFAFGPDEMEILIAANGFKPTRKFGRFPFALRGAELVSSLASPATETKQEDRPALTLRDTRPDHRSLKCVIGVYDIDRRSMSGFTASTVPNPKAVASHVARPPQANMMLTGCYPFTVGWHQYSKPEKRIPGCLIEAGFQKAMLRTNRDHTFDVTDDVDNRAPCGDNMHPGKSEGPFPFSSWGCLVTKGSVEPLRGGNREQVKHTGEWALFRKALGLPDRGTGRHDDVFDVILITGLEAAIAHSIVAKGGAMDSAPLLRLRQGSRGERVARLQRALVRPVTNVFDHATARALADKQRAKLGWADGTYSLAMDAALGFDVFAPIPVAVASLESRSAAAAADGELESLYFQMGLEAKTPRRSYFESTAVAESDLESTILQYGQAALKSAGRSIAGQIEQQIHAYVCGPDSSAHGDIRDQVDKASKIGTGALRSCLVTLISMTTPSLITRETIDKFVGILIEKIFAPLAGQVGAGAVSRIEGGVAQVCARWEQRLGLMTQPTPALDSAPKAPAGAAPAVSAQETETTAVINRIEAAAKGDKPDVPGVRELIRGLYDSGAALTQDQSRRLLAALGNSHVLEQLAGAVGRNPYDILNDIESALDAEPVDRAAVDLRVRALCEILANPGLKLEANRARDTVEKMRSKRMLEHVTLLADRLLTRDPDPKLLATIGPYYGLALIDCNRIIAGMELLRATLAKAELTNELEKEVYGNLGRGHKQIYVNHVKTPGDAVALEKSIATQIGLAIDSYGRCYDVAKPGENYWHGVNYIALLTRAKNDRIKVAPTHDPADLARAMLAALLPQAENPDDPFVFASIGEAYLALSEFDNAAKYYAKFAAHPKTNAHRLNSAVRQLEDVWRFNAGKVGGAGIVVGLKAALAQKEGGRIRLSAGERDAIQNADTVAHQEHFESRTASGKFVPLEYLKRIVVTGAAVAAIKRRRISGQPPQPGSGETIGTGFLIDGESFGLDPAKSYLLTNAHVLWDSTQGQGNENSAISPAEAEIVFDGMIGPSRSFTTPIVKWQSPSCLHDATLIELGPRIEGVDALKPALKSLSLTPDDGSGNTGTALAVVGHPEGGPLAIGVGGSLEEMRARLVDIGPKGKEIDPQFLHYTAPTEPGNSGSPVLEAQNWSVVALHHAGFDEQQGRPRLCGKAGRNQANEGVHLESIRAAAREKLKPPPPAKKSGWFS